MDYIVRPLFIRSWNQSYIWDLQFITPIDNINIFTFVFKPCFIHNILQIASRTITPRSFTARSFTKKIMSEVPSQYNSQTVIDAANTKLQEEGINAAQTVFQSALLDWVDDVTMGDHENNIEDGVKGEIAKLWLAYADLNRQANMVSLNIEVKI